jgi:hypothetical protein
MRGYYGLAQNNENIEQIKRDSFPTGTNPPYTLMMGDKGSLVTATTTLYQSNSFENLNLAGGLNGESSFDGTSTLSGELGALAYLISAISGSGELSGDIKGAVDIAADLAGSGDLTGALGALISILADLNANGDLSGDIAGALAATADLAGSGDISGAIKGSVSILSDLTGTSALTSAIIGNWDMAVAISGSGTIAADIAALAHLISDLIASGELDVTSGATPGDMSSDISSFSTLSPENLAAAVWNSIAAAYNNSGTMGEIMNNVGAGADPWSTILPASYTGTQAGAIMNRIQTLVDELHKLQGLNIDNSVTITKTSVNVDNIDLELTGDGEYLTVIQRL